MSRAQRKSYDSSPRRSETTLVEGADATPRGTRSRSTMPARVLLVDDDEGLRRSIARALELEGYAVDLAGDGLEALEFFADGLERPDAVVLDVLMPKLDGLATCRRIREVSDVPVLMLTARHSVGDRVNGLDTGADHYLGKPFAVIELLARVNALIRRTSATTPRIASCATPISS